MPLVQTKTGKKSRRPRPACFFHFAPFYLKIGRCIFDTFIDFPSMKYYTFSKAGIFAKPWQKRRFWGQFRCNSNAFSACCRLMKKYSFPKLGVFSGEYPV